MVIGVWNFLGAVFEDWAIYRELFRLCCSILRLTSKFWGYGTQFWGLVANF
jgi:hypothetical protein